MQASDRPGLAVGGVTAAGYLGFLAGAPLVGVLADRWGLRTGVLALAGAAAAATLAASMASAISRPPTGS